jgi:hypothetical protein
MRAGSIMRQSLAFGRTKAGRARAVKASTTAGMLGTSTIHFRHEMKGGAGGGAELGVQLDDMVDP